jgi:hypothetical protein
MAVPLSKFGKAYRHPIPNPFERREGWEAAVLVAEWHRFKGGKIAHVESAFDSRPYEAIFMDKTAV